MVGFVKPRQGRRLFGAGHGWNLENDGTQCLLGDSLFTAKSRKQAQAACKGNAKAHSFSASGRLYFLDFIPSCWFAKVPL